MTSPQYNLFFSKSTKGKYSNLNMYQSDGFKNSNFSDIKKPKTSMSPNRLLLSKSAKNNPILPMMKSYNNNNNNNNILNNNLNNNLKSKDYVNKLN
jgi:hypothetical protein